MVTGALFYSPVDFTDASDCIRCTLMQSDASVKSTGE